MKTSSQHLPLFNEHLQTWKIKSLIVSALRRLWQPLMESFVGSDELRVLQTYDRLGNNWWHAYNPATGRYTSVNSEAEPRTSIETRYYK